jgi:hypothetical protein
MLLLPWKYASTYIPFRHIPKLFCSYTGSKETKNIPSSIASPLCCAIKLHIYVTTSINVYKRDLGIILWFEKEREKFEKEKKERIILEEHLHI